MAKDNFSLQSADYARFRPHYPAALCGALADLAPAREQAWDCGAGNGQFTVLLAKHFTRVYASDISADQLKNAVQKPNILYRQESAEKGSLPNQSCDLITVAQAIHWFDFEAFYREVRRVARPGAVIAAIGYALFRTASKLDEIVQHFYTQIVGPYWDPERKLIDEKYRTIPFPFEELPFPECYMEYQWSLEEMLGYFGTWSATQHYIRDRQSDPVTLIQNPLAAAWPETKKISVRFDILARVGRVSPNLIGRIP